MKSIDGINLRNATASLGNAVTRKSQPRRTIASGYVSAVQSDVSGKITTATVQIAGSGSVRAQVPFGANVYTGMGVQIENHGSPSAASWAIAGSSYLPTGTSGGTIINQNGNVIGMFESIWVQDDGFIIAGGLEDSEGNITGPRTMLTQDGFFGWDAYDRESFGIWVRDVGERLAGDMLMGYDDGGRIELSAQNRSFGIWNAGEVILLFDQATGNRITKNLWVGDEAGPQVGIGQFGDAAVIVARNKGSGTMGDIGNEPVFMVSTYEDGDEGGVRVHIGDPDHSGSYISYDSATPGELIVDADVRARKITIFGEGLIAEGGYIATHDDNTRAGLKMTDRYLEGTGTGGDRTFLLVGAAISLPRHPLLPEHGNINWVGGDGYWGDILHNNFRILHGDSEERQKVGLFNGDTPLVWADYDGDAYFKGVVYVKDETIRLGYDDRGLEQILPGGGVGFGIDDGSSSVDVKNLVTFVDENYATYGGLWCAHYETTPGSGIENISMHVGTVAQNNVISDARSYVRILSNSHVGREAKLTLIAAGDNGSAPQSIIELLSQGGDDGNYARIDITGLPRLRQHETVPSATTGMTLPNGLFGFPDGSVWNPLTYITAGQYLTARVGTAWVPLAQAWGTEWRWGDGSTNYTSIDAAGTQSYVGTARTFPRYKIATKAAGNFNVDVTEAGHYRVNATTGGATVATLPTATAATKGTRIKFSKVDGGGNTVTISTVASGNIVLSTQWQYCEVEAQDSTWERVG